MAFYSVINHPVEDAVTITFTRPHSRKSICLGAKCDIKGISKDPELKRIHKRWSKMLEYVTDNTQTNYICTDWLTFSNFVAWHKANDSGVPKLVTNRVDGIKVYSPEHTWI